MATRRPFSRERSESRDRSKRGRDMPPPSRHSERRSNPSTPSRAAHEVPLPPDSRNPFQSPRTRSVASGSRRSVRSSDSMFLRSEVADLTNQVKGLLSVVSRQQTDIQQLVQVQMQQAHAIQFGSQQQQVQGGSNLPSQAAGVPASSSQQVPVQGSCGSVPGPSSSQIPQIPSSLGSSPGDANATHQEEGNSNPVMIVLPDGQRIALGSPVNQGQGGQAGGSQLDAFQKGDKWLPELPKVDPSKWKSRIDEIIGYLLVGSCIRHVCIRSQGSHE